MQACALICSVSWILAVSKSALCLQWSASHNSTQLHIGLANITSNPQVKMGTTAAVDPANIRIACTLAKLGLDVLAHQHLADTLDDDPRPLQVRQEQEMKLQNSLETLRLMMS